MYFDTNVAPLIHLGQDEGGRVCYALYDSVKSEEPERSGYLAPYLVAKWPLVRRWTVILYLDDRSVRLGEVDYA